MHAQIKAPSVVCGTYYFFVWTENIWRGETKSDYSKVTKRNKDGKAEHLR